MENKDFKVGDSFDIYRIDDNGNYLSEVFTPGTFRPGENEGYITKVFSNLKSGGCYHHQSKNLTKVATMRITKLK